LGPSLALDSFDKEPGNEIAVLGECGRALLMPGTYAVKSQDKFSFEECDGCVHMHPYLVPDGKGGLFVASSDGLSDSRGHLLWALNIRGFTRLLPIRNQAQQPVFLAYDRSDRIECRDRQGKVIWNFKLHASDVGSYTTPAGEKFPFALTGNRAARKCQVFDLQGNLHRTIPIPGWASDVEGISWPAQGHLLVGAGSRMAVLDQDGKEVFRHIIKDTSFEPYHGPIGAAISFDPAQKPYLAVRAAEAPAIPVRYCSFLIPKVVSSGRKK
jgi:hypothetical protein